MNWWYVPLFYLGIFIGGYIWGAARTIAENDVIKRQDKVRREKLKALLEPKNK